jgi:hypothetical protein
MKLFFLVFILFELASARQIRCQQNPRDVGVIVNQEASKVSIQVHSPLGFDYLPLIEGPIRASMKGWMEYQFQQLKILGSDFRVEFPSSKCEWNASKSSKISSLLCTEALAGDIQNLRFHTLSVSQVNEKGVKLETYYRKFRLSVSVKGEFGEDTFFISIPVPELGCLERE